jgi:lysophospholipase L1-like esterase
MKRILLPILFAAALLVLPTACSHTHPVSAAAPKAAASPPAAPAPVAPPATMPTTAQNANVVTFNTATNPVPRDAAWVRRHEGFVRQAQTNNMDILFLGDSITDFWRNRGLSVWNQIYAPRHAANFGISGDRTQHLLWRIDHGELNGIHPKVVVLLIGINNTGSYRDMRRNTVPEVAEGVRAVVNDIRARLPNSKILLLGVFPHASLNNPLRAQVALINTLIAKLDDGKMVKFLDIGPKFLEFDGTLPRSIMPDSLHPNAKGYQIWAEAMEPALDEMLK